MPRIGHARTDLTDRPVLFWPLHDILIAYRPDTRPIQVVRVLHGARDPEGLRKDLGRRPPDGDTRP
jgi:antitoxin ParD1/3/4/toxin ParE1/3/4